MVVSPKYGRTPIELAPGLNSIKCSGSDDAIKNLEKLKTLTGEGKLDKMLEAAAAENPQPVRQVRGRSSITRLLTSPSERMGWLWKFLWAVIIRTLALALKILGWAWSLCSGYLSLSSPSLETVGRWDSASGIGTTKTRNLKIESSRFAKWGIPRSFRVGTTIGSFKISL